MIAIYALSDPRDGEIRYVGQTCRKPACRLNQHVREAIRGGNLHSKVWIRGMLAEGLRPELNVIELTPDTTAADARETFWIAKMRELGSPLTNRAMGGSSRRGWKQTPLALARLAERKGEKHPRFGVKLPPEQIEAMRMRGRQRGSPMQGKKHSPETKEKIKAHRALNPPKVSAQGRENQRAAMRARWANPEFRAQWSEKMSGPNNPTYGRTFTHSAEAIAKISAASAARRHRPETIEKIRQSAILRAQRNKCSSPSRCI